MGTVKGRGSAIAFFSSLAREAARGRAARRMGERERELAGLGTCNSPPFRCAPPVAKKALCPRLSRHLDRFSPFLRGRAARKHAERGNWGGAGPGRIKPLRQNEKKKRRFVDFPSKDKKFPIHPFSHLAVLSLRPFSAEKTSLACSLRRERELGGSGRAGDWKWERLGEAVGNWHKPVKRRKTQRERENSEARGKVELFCIRGFE